ARKVDVEQRRLADLVERILALERRRQGAVHQVEAVEANGPEDRGLALEVLVERRGAHAEARRDATHREPLFAQLGTQFDGGLHDGLLQRTMVGAPGLLAP